MSTLALCSDTPYINDITQGYIFAILILLLSTALNLPFSIYHTFSIEERYGLNKVSKAQFLCDQVKTFALQCLIFAVFVPLLLWVMAKSADNRLILIVALAGTTIALNILVNFLLPKLILPLFFECEELEDEELKVMITELGVKSGIAVRDVKVLIGSQRQNYSNAIVSGLCGPRDVILLDTLLESHNDEEILAVVSHEFGLAVNCHIYKQVVASSIQLLVLFGLFSFCMGNKKVLLSFGFTHTSNFLYLFIFGNLYIPV